MGMQIALIGMTSVGMVVKDEDTLVTLGRLDNPHLWISFGGLILVGTLLHHGVTGGILLGIVIVAIITWTVDWKFPTVILEIPEMKLGLWDLFDFHHMDIISILPSLFSFLFIGLVDVSVCTFGISSLAGLDEPDGSVPGSLYAFLGCGIGTMVGSALGTAPVIVYVESTAGIKEGGRTGLTAIVISILFFLSVVFAPLIAKVPETATSSVAILVGAMMMSQAREINWDNMTEAIPAYITIAAMPFTFSITNGLLAGLLASFLFYITTGEIFADIYHGLRSLCCRSSSSEHLELLNRKGGGKTDGYATTNFP
jgi:AGZA family xanthine/uracil permease-like MFS transporter